MANAQRDNNRTTISMGVLCDDGVTPIPIAVDAMGNVEVDEVSIVLPSSLAARRDDNRVPVLLGVSSEDPTRTFPVYVNAQGKILIAR